MQNKRGAFVHQHHGQGRPSASPIDADLGSSCEKYSEASPLEMSAPAARYVAAAGRRGRGEPTGLSDVVLRRTDRHQSHALRRISGRSWKGRRGSGGRLERNARL